MGNPGYTVEFVNEERLLVPDSISWSGKLCCISFQYYTCSHKFPYVLHHIPSYSYVSLLVRAMNSFSSPWYKNHFFRGRAGLDTQDAAIPPEELWGMLTWWGVVQLSGPWFCFVLHCLFKCSTSVSQDIFINLIWRSPSWTTKEVASSPIWNGRAGYYKFRVGRWPVYYLIILYLIYLPSGNLT